MAPQVNLSEAQEFEDTIRAAAEHHGMLPDLVRKDYWVTRVLRAIASDVALQGTVLLKGGTSLSKGWGLIDRFSEDVDLLLTGPNFGPAPERAKDRERRFRALKERIEVQTPLRLPAQGTVSREVWNWLYLRADYKCDIRYPLPGKVADRNAANSDWILVESGFRGDAQPHANRQLSALIAQFLDTQPGAREALVEYADDLTAFDLDLLKPERTFAEKLLGLHELMIQGDEGAGRVPTRHYYDLVQLFRKSADVQHAIASGEMQTLIREAAEISNRYFGAALDVERLTLRDSPALDPTATQLGMLRAAYVNALERAMYYRRWVPFDELMVGVGAIRDSL